MSEIKKRVPLTEILAGLAEECGELVQAALKLRRVFDKTSYTPMSEDEAIENLFEEIADVKLYMSLIDTNEQYIEQIQKRKMERWKERLGIEK